MPTWNQRVKERRVELGWSAAELARRASVKPPTVFEWEEGITKQLKATTAQRLSRALGVSTGWLLEGRRPKLLRGHDVDDGVPPPNSRPTDRMIPIISSVQAGLWSDANDPYPVGFGEGEIPVQFLPVPVGPRAFGLRLKGDSMLDQFQNGDIVVIDPDSNPRPSEPVVAKRDEDDEATFKVYRPRGHDDRGNPIIELVPLNEHFPVLVISADHPGRIIGPMVASISGRRNFSRS